MTVLLTRMSHNDEIASMSKQSSPAVKTTTALLAIHTFSPSTPSPKPEEHGF
jgi:hypothetical protein